MATKKTPAKVKKIIATAKKEQNKIITKMVNQIGKEMTPKKRKKSSTRKRSKSC